MTKPELAAKIAEALWREGLIGSSPRVKAYILRVLQDAEEERMERLDVLEARGEEPSELQRAVEPFRAVLAEIDNSTSLLEGDGLERAPFLPTVGALRALVRAVEGKG